MTINVQITAKQDGNLPHRGADVTIGDRAYHVFVTPSYVTVLARPHARLGKTFHADARCSNNEAALVRNYKRHGKELLEIVHNLRAEMAHGKPGEMA